MIDHTWFNVRVGEATFRMSLDAVKVDGLRQIYNPVELNALCEELNALPATPFLLDQRFLQSSYRNDPAPKYYPGGVGMATHDAVVEHNLRIEETLVEITRRDGNRAVGNVGKPFTWPLQHESLYGWHLLQPSYTWRGIKLHDAVSGVPQLKVIQQPTIKAHAGINDKLIEPTHKDYSSTAVLVDSTCTVDGTCIPTLDLYQTRSPLAFGPSVVSPLRSLPGHQGPHVAAGQAFLQGAGFSPGPVDGLHGRRTEAAWLAWETAQTGAGPELLAYPFKQARWYNPGRHEPIKWIVIHTAEIIEHNLSAENLQSYALDPKGADGKPRKVSWHYAVDNDSVAQCVKDSDRAYAAGPANDLALHIELAGYARQTASDWSDPYSRSELALAARLVAQKCSEHDIPVRWLDDASVERLEAGIVGHENISRVSQKMKAAREYTKPWYVNGQWVTTTHADPGAGFPREQFIQAVRSAMV